MRDSEDSTGKFMLAMIGGAVVAAPMLGIWPVIGVIAVCLCVIGVAKLLQHRR